MKRVIERLLNLLAFLLTVGRPVSADEIRNTVAGYDQGNDEAFRRMFERDKDLLRRLGVPLELAPTDEWEVEFGYVVPPDEYGLTGVDLTDEERAALWLAAQVVRLGGQPSGPDAILKLGGSPFTAAGEPLAADLGPAADQLALAFQAVSERRLLAFDYRDRARTVRPYGLLHRRGHWYLVGESDQIRAYRIDRAHGFEVGETAEAFERPDGFDLRRALPEAPWEAGGEDIEATVTFDSEVAWWARRQLSSDSSVTEGANGALEATLRVANPDAFIGWILGFGASAEVTAPPELRRRVLERALAQS